MSWLWPCKAVLGNRATFSKLTYFQEGRAWWEWHQLAISRLQRPLVIVFAFISTHNHFTLSRGGQAFNRTAPVVELGHGAGLGEYQGLLGLLNSSSVCFWMKQVAFNKDALPNRNKELVG